VRIGVALMARIRALIARDPPPTSPSPFIAALAAGTGLRLLAMLGYPGALWFAGDSYVYLGSALRLRPDLSKTTGYSLFLRALEPFHSLTLVTGVQHLMGLGVAVMIYLLLRRSGVSPRWATAATLPVLLDGFEIEDEHMVMAEALFTFLIMLAMLLILWRARVPWPAALLAGLLVGYAVDVRSEGLPVLVLFPGFLLLRALSRGGWRNWRNRSVWLAAIVMAAGCAVPVLGYVAWSRSWNGSWTLSRSDGFYLWGRVSSFAECSVIKPPADELKICPTGSPSSRTPPGDYVWHAPQVHDIAGGPVSVANDALLRDFAIRAVEAQPLAYLHAVLGGLALAVEWPQRPYPDAGTVYYYYFHLTPQTVPASHSWIPGGTAYSDAVQYGHATPSRVVKPFAILIDGYERVFYVYGPLFGLILITGLGGVVRIRRRPLRLIRLRGACRPGSMLPWVTAVVLLVFPIAVTDFDYRYLLPVLPFACLAAGLAFAPARSASPEVRAERVHREPPPAVGVALPDGPHGAGRPDPLDGFPPEPFDRAAAAD
jgi:Dolichyl-phosphate-mannose-protein mannosyltransferase